MSQINVLPYVFENRAGGLQLTEIRPGSIFDKIGLRDGDVIHEINGTTIQSPYKLAAIYKGLKLI